MTRKTSVLIKGAIALFCVAFASIPSESSAQASDRQIEILRTLGTPIGAIPPISLPMLASRNNNYWITRLQTGYRRGPSGTAMPSAAAGVDFQYRGGSILGLTGGWQARDCGLIEGPCGGHALFGARAQINVMTGGRAMAGLLHDNSTTSTFGTDIGFGYARDVVPGIDACTLDFGVPYSVAKRRQRPRLVAFVTPGVIVDIKCGTGGPPSQHSYMTNFGLALQQVGNRSFDIYLGLQKIFRPGAGLQTGITIAYVKLPR
jgi:hypothetical protein